MKPLALLMSTIAAAFGLKVVDEKGFSKSVNHVGFKLFRQITNDTENPILSTLSLCALFSLLYLGAGSESTVKDLREFLGYEKFNVEQPAKLFQDYLKKITFDNEDDYIFMMANAILLENEFPLKKNYKTMVKENFLTEIANVNFTDGANIVSEVVNDWVKLKTRGKIENLLCEPLTDDNKLVILSAVFFRGNWKFSFHQKSTETRKFYNWGNSTDITNVPTLYLNSRILYTRSDLFRAVQLPYRGDDYSLLIVLPEELDGIYTIQPDFSDENLEQIIWDMHETHIELYLPKLTIKSSVDLESLLKESGMKEIWTSSADLSKIAAKKSLFLTDGRHAVDFGIREGMRNRPPPSPKGDMPQGTFLGDAAEVFVVDHPFLFFVVDIDNDMAIIEGRIDGL